MTNRIAGSSNSANVAYVKNEKLSLELVDAEPPAGAHRADQTVDGHDVVLGVTIAGR